MSGITHAGVQAWSNGQLLGSMGPDGIILRQKKTRISGGMLILSILHTALHRTQTTSIDE